MRIFIDSNLLTYLNAVRTAKDSVLYENLHLNIFSDNKAYMDVLVLDELLYISKKKYNIPYSISTEFIESITFPHIEISPLGGEELDKALEIVKTFNVKPSDALHITEMMKNGISKIASEDGYSIK